MSVVQDLSYFRKQLSATPSVRTSPFYCAFIRPSVRSSVHHVLACTNYRALVRPFVTFFTLTNYCAFVRPSVRSPCFLPSPITVRLLSVCPFVTFSTLTNKNRTVKHKILTIHLFNCFQDIF